MGKGSLIDEGITHSIIGAFYDVYNSLGCGFLEQLYVRALEYELLSRGHSVSREYCVRVYYKQFEIGVQRLDMVVDQRIVVEVKSTLTLDPSATRQVYNYLKGTNLDVGLLLHFGREPSLRRLFCRRDRRDRRDPDASVYPLVPSS